MNAASHPQLVPASLVRVRCFLNRRGMKVKPWLGPKEVLAAFHRILVAQQRDDSFWTELRTLLGELAADLRARVAARGLVIDNELLDAAQHEALLTEIRDALAEKPKATLGLHRLAEVLSAPASALLLMMGASVAVGCGGSSTAEGAAGSAGDAQASGGSSAVGGASSLGGNSSSASGGSSGLNAADYAACDQALVAALLPCPSLTDSRPTSVAGELLTRHLLDCVCVLDAAWQSGLRDLFADASCEAIEDYFGCCGIAPVCSAADASPQPSYDANLLIDNSCCLVYLGVRA